MHTNMITNDVMGCETLRWTLCQPYSDMRGMGRPDAQEG